jgi:hypothetical protein
VIVLLLVVVAAELVEAQLDVGDFAYEGVFTTPWSATITYGRGSNDWPEIVCAENVKKYYEKDTAVPTADKLDF